MGQHLSDAPIRICVREGPVAIADARVLGPSHTVVEHNVGLTVTVDVLRNQRKGVLPLCLGALFVAAPAMSQEKTSITLEDLVSASIARNRSILALRQRVALSDVDLVGP